MDCGDLADVAAELALGVLTGRERAQAVAYLDGCDACRENVRQLTVAGEELLGLLPGSVPPAGFECRVLDRLGLAGQRRGGPGPRHGRPRPRSRRLLAAAAAAVIVAGAGLGWSMRGMAPAGSPLARRPPGPGVARAAFTSVAAHRHVGSIFLYRGSPGWLYMTVDLGSGNGRVFCRLTARDGRPVMVGSFRLFGGEAYWGSPERIPPSDVTGAQLTTAGGTVLARATLGGTR
jgi:hypothetical protein